MDNDIPVVRDTVSDQLCPALFQCFTIILCGYVAGRLNVVSKVESKGIATFVGTFALPSLIFLSLARLDFSTVNWIFLFSILLAKGLVFFAVLIITLLVSKPMNLGQAGIFAIFCTQSNDFALGYPIINAIYENTHPEYALYLYLMAPISLAILNPVAFVLMEIHKQRETSQASEMEIRQDLHKFKMFLQLLKGIIYNPVLIMTILGIIGNVAFKHKISIYIEGLLDVFGQSFSAAALFLLGLRMVGQITRLKGSALVLPCVLITAKLICLPVIMREFVSTMDAGANDSETQSLSTYAFLYGTIPTAPAVFVFSNLYNLETDLIASSMVICTFISAPITFLSAQVISINKDFADQIKKFSFELSIVSLVAAVWVLIVFILTRKYQRMPHRLTVCLNLTQILFAVSVIWGGTHTGYVPSLSDTLQQTLLHFSNYSCALWIAMLSVGMLLLESRGPCFLLTLWPVLAFVAWGAPAVMVGALLATRGDGPVSAAAADAIRLSVLFFSITVTIGSLIVYLRQRRRHSLASVLASHDGADPARTDETAQLVDNGEPASNTQAVSNFGGGELQGCYGTITSSPQLRRRADCCSGDPGCDSGLLVDGAPEIEDLVINDRWCACAASGGPLCDYAAQLEQAAGSLGLLPPETSRGRGGQMLRHTLLIMAHSLGMFIGLTYTTWKVMRKDESGVFIEIQFLDTAARCGQVLVMFVLFGLDAQEVVIPAVRYFQNKWHGTDTVTLPPVEELSFETKLVCEQFITHHLERCREAIAKDTRWRMRAYRSVFRGSCLVRWLIQCGLAADAPAAEQYARHLLDGRLIAHVNDAHHFVDSPLLYRFL